MSEDHSTHPGRPSRRVVAEGLPEFRALVSERMTAMGWPMYDDDEGAVYLKVDGLFDAIITASLAVIGDKLNTDDGEDAA